MLSDASLLVRAIRALTALVTVWCLGCAGFEPLLDSVLGSGDAVGMACGGTAQSFAPAASSDQSASTAFRTVAAPPGSQRGFDCGCGGTCHAPLANGTVTVAGMVPLDRVERRDPPRPPSADYAILLPPPETVAS